MMKITVTQAIGIFHALSSLSTYERIVKQGGVEAVARAPYQFSATTRLSMAHNIEILRVCERVYVAARNGLVQQLSENGNEVAKARMPEFADENDKLLGESIEVDLRSFDANDLRLDENPIDPGTLAALLPIIEH
jgi:hypothetical protein